MAGNKPDTERTAVDLLQNAKEIPKPGQQTDFPIPTIFGGGLPGTNPFVNEDTPKEHPGVAIRMRCETRTYTLWRPVNGCDRCKKAIGNGDVVLPEEVGDYTCPHVQAPEYQEQVNRILGGETIKQQEEFFMLKSGLRCVQLVWLEPDKDFVKQMAEQKKRKEDLPYPPRPDKVFSQPLEDEPKSKN